MTIPIISLGGTSAMSLIDALCKANDALQTAIDAVVATAPNGRDYPQNFSAAIKEHQQRIDALIKIKTDLQLLAIAIDEAR